MDSEKTTQRVFRIPRSVYRQHGRWPAITPALAHEAPTPRGPRPHRARTASQKASARHCEHPEHSAQGLARWRPGSARDYREVVAELANGSHWYSLSVRDQRGERVQLMSAAPEGRQRDDRARVFGFKEAGDGSVTVRELLSIASHRPREHVPYVQLIPVMQDRDGLIYLQGRETPHRVYRARLHWAD